MENITLQLKTTFTKKTYVNIIRNFFMTSFSIYLEIKSQCKTEIATTI